MKLKNKQTGEIVEFLGEFHRENKPTFVSDDSYTLEKLCEEWEDYEKEPPKTYWRIYSNGGVFETTEDNTDYDLGCNQIGNCFDTKEEAEKAVKKLKAWKRLKDKGFKFKGGDDASISYEIDWQKWGDEDEMDFEFLFGGEE